VRSLTDDKRKTDTKYLASIPSHIVMASDDIRESKNLVRIYSFELEERLPPGNDAHVLGKILGEEDGSIESVSAPWRKFFESQTPAQGDR
jgi:hypothetical protein